MNTRKVRIYPLFERFWHWSQMLLVMTMLFTGFAVRGSHSLISFESAVNLHTKAAIALMVLWVFAIFWHLTTGSWKHYVPTTEGLLKVARYYAFGIFKGDHHPYRKAFQRKHNPLQALAYLLLKVLLFPALWVTGLFYLGYNFWEHQANASFWLNVVVNIHVLAAFAMMAFVIVHLYLLTAGHSFWAHLKPMITGFDCVDLTKAEEAYLESNDPRQLK